MAVSNGCGVDQGLGDGLGHGLDHGLGHGLGHGLDRGAKLRKLHSMQEIIGQVERGELAPEADAFFQRARALTNEAAMRSPEECESGESRESRESRESHWASESGDDATHDGTHDAVLRACTGAVQHARSVSMRREGARCSERRAVRMSRVVERALAQCEQGERGEAGREDECRDNISGGLSDGTPRRDARQATRAESSVCVPTGWRAYDEFLGGGLRTGELHEFVGVDFSGADFTDAQRSPLLHPPASSPPAQWIPPLGVAARIAWRALGEAPLRQKLVVWIGRAIAPPQALLIAGLRPDWNVLAKRTAWVTSGVTSGVTSWMTSQRGDQDTPSPVRSAQQALIAREPLATAALLDRSLVLLPEPVHKRGMQSIFSAANRSCHDQHENHGMQERLWCAEQALSVAESGASVGVIIVDARGFDVAACRRLQMAARQNLQQSGSGSSGVLVLLLRSPTEVTLRSCMAATRWKVTPSKAMHDGMDDGMDDPGWSVELLRSRRASRDGRATVEQLAPQQSCADWVARATTRATKLVPWVSWVPGVVAPRDALRAVQRATPVCMSEELSHGYLQASESERESKRESKYGGVARTRSFEQPNTPNITTEVCGIPHDRMATRSRTASTDETALASSRMVGHGQDTQAGGDQRIDRSTQRSWIDGGTVAKDMEADTREQLHEQLPEQLHEQAREYPSAASRLEWRTAPDLPSVPVGSSRDTRMPTFSRRRGNTSRHACSGMLFPWFVLGHSPGYGTRPS